MKFGPYPIDECLGAILAHGLTLPEQRLKKGHVLQKDDLIAAQQMGLHQLIVARLEADEVLENEAAALIADALKEPAAGLRIASAFTGRVNIYAAHYGLFVANRQTVDALNSIDPAITLATLPDTSLIEAGRMVATVKIIPFAVSQAHVEKAVKLAEAATALNVHDAKLKRISLVQTTLDNVKESTLDKTRKVLDDRLSLFSACVHRELRVPHTQDAVETALGTIKNADDFDSSKDLIVIFGASAITDQADIIPAAVTRLGTVSSFGMPVDPGNLLMVGSYAGVAVIGAPGCARSPAENGFDWVLQRLVHGVEVDAGWVSSLGVGGLLMEIHDRPQPREGRVDE